MLEKLWKVISSNNDTDLCFIDSLTKRAFVNISDEMLLIANSVHVFFNSNGFSDCRWVRMLLTSHHLPFKFFAPTLDKFFFLVSVVNVKKSKVRFTVLF